MQRFSVAVSILINESIRDGKVSTKWSDQLGSGEREAGSREPDRLTMGICLCLRLKRSRRSMRWKEAGADARSAAEGPFSDDRLVDSYHQ